MAELPGQTAGGHQKDPGEGEQQREIHQQPAGTSDPGVPQRPGHAQRGKRGPLHTMIHWQAAPFQSEDACFRMTCGVWLFLHLLIDILDAARVTLLIST